MEVKKLYPEGKEKALTFSYDDGIEQDKRFVGILNKYGIKCTFNLNSALSMKQDGWMDANDVFVKRMPPEELPLVYKDHEVAMHMANHPHPTQLSDAELIKETTEDREFHTNLFGYPVKGMAYPFGEYNSHVIEVLNNLGVLYSRTISATHQFGLPEEWLEWNPTCHHADNLAESLWTSFLDCKEELALFYVWGHSYEFDTRNHWGRIEEFCKNAAGHENIYYATNMELYVYITGIRQLKIEEHFIHNPSALPIWVAVSGKKQKIEAGKTLEF